MRIKSKLALLAGGVILALGVACNEAPTPEPIIVEHQRVKFVTPTPAPTPTPTPEPTTSPEDRALVMAMAECIRYGKNAPALPKVEELRRNPTLYHHNCYWVKGYVVQARVPDPTGDIGVIKQNGHLHQVELRNGGGIVAVWQYYDDCPRTDNERLIERDEVSFRALFIDEFQFVTSWGSEARLERPAVICASS